MSELAMPTQFMAKRWVFVVQAIFFGAFAAFGLILGPLFLFGFMKDVKGNPATDAGIALTSMSLPFVLIFALAIYNLKARRRPLLRLCREGIEFVLIGSSSLDGIPMIPGLVRLAWLILSTQGFRQQVVCIPWRDFECATVSGPPMDHCLTIEDSLSLVTSQALPLGTYATDRIVLREATFRTPLAEIATAINLHASKPDARGGLASWGDVVPADA